MDAHSLVFVHDGVRCLVTPQLIRRCGEAALENDNAIPSVAAIETSAFKLATVMNLLTAIGFGSFKLRKLFSAM